jgi:hypothetical protein
MTDLLARFRRGYRSSAAAIGPWRTWALIACMIVAAAASVGGIAWLLGVHRASNLFDTAQARHALEAVKQWAGRRIQARTIEITPETMTICAVDPEMSPWRWVDGTRSHPGHYYYAPGVYEQSWHVTRWSFFGRDWYRVSGPEPEGVIQEKRGPGFDLRADDIPDLPVMINAALTRAGFAAAISVDRLSLDSLGWNVTVSAAPHFAIEQFDRQGSHRGELKQ